MKKQLLLPAITIVLALAVIGIAVTRSISNDDIQMVYVEQNSNSDQGYRININTATAEELDLLPGIGPALAQRIIEYRTIHGPYRSVDDLLLVKGIGEKTLDGFRDYIVVR